jgi:hypothetical protein
MRHSCKRIELNISRKLRSKGTSADEDSPAQSFVDIGKPGTSLLAPVVNMDIIGIVDVNCTPIKTRWMRCSDARQSVICHAQVSEFELAAVTVSVPPEI